MEITESNTGAVAVISPKGPLSGDDAKAVRDSAFAAIAQRRGRVVLDFAAVPFVDSAGLESLLDLADELAACGRSLKLCAVNPTVREALEVVGFSNLIEQFADVNAAARSFL